MSFERLLRIPTDRIGALLGKGGRVKDEIEKRCGVNLSVDSRTGEVKVGGRENLMEMQPFKAVDIITAIARGFSPERAFRLLDEDAVIDVIDLREYAGKSPSNLSRIKGRIIGIAGKSRRLIEELTGTFISIYGHTVCVIGAVSEARLAREAIDLLASGSPHKTVYSMLQRARTKAKVERMKLWEGE